MFKIKLTNLYDIYDSCYFYSKSENTTYLLNYSGMTNRGAKYLVFKKSPKRGWFEFAHTYYDTILDYLETSRWRQVEYPKEYDQGETKGEGVA